MGGRDLFASVQYLSIELQVAFCFIDTTLISRFMYNTDGESTKSERLGCTNMRHVYLFKAWLALSRA
jgi:hypothetical protein